MPYKHDDEARQEAACHPVSEDEAARLQEQCARKADRLGTDGVRGHEVCFSVIAWDEPILPRTGRISRGHLLDIGQHVRDRKQPAADLLTASLAWGYGTTGYGARRLHDIREAARDQLEPSLQRALTATRQDASPPDPVAGYAHLYGGDHDHRAAPGQPPWSRLHRFGPAFFTKFLYFSTPGALILDNRLANAVARSSRLPHLITQTGRSRAWTPYRYAVYLHWMNQTARTIGAEPDLLELTLFQPPPDDPDGEQDAAD